MQETYEMEAAVVYIKKKKKKASNFPLKIKVIFCFCSWVFQGWLLILEVL